MGPAVRTALDGTPTPQGPQGCGLGAPSNARPPCSPGNISPQGNPPRRGPCVTRHSGLGVEGDDTAQEIAMKPVGLQARAAEGSGAANAGLGVKSCSGVVRSLRAIAARRQRTDFCAEVPLPRGGSRPWKSRTPQLSRAVIAFPKPESPRPRQISPRSGLGRLVPRAAKLSAGCQRARGKQESPCSASRKTSRPVLRPPGVAAARVLHSPTTTRCPALGLRRRGVAEEGPRQTRRARQGTWEECPSPGLQVGHLCQRGENAGLVLKAQS
nr:uncharacterized protein LOC105725205 [Aotus nancymaae]